MYALAKMSGIFASGSELFNKIELKVLLGVINAGCSVTDFLARFLSEVKLHVVNVLCWNFFPLGKQFLLLGLRP